tara:strand:+ start:290 stop:778 length:489 start_codon:yes stop_codon:yes gene_type:complete
MKKKIFLILFFIPLLVYSQGNVKNKIQWLNLNEAQEYSKKYKKNMFVYFYRPNCEYCERMKSETLSDTSIINLINNNFLPVMLNGRTKDTLIFNNIRYSNQQPVDHGATFRHDLYFELVNSVKGQLFWPSSVIVSSDYQKLISIPGFQPKRNYSRLLKRYIK